MNKLILRIYDYLKTHKFLCVCLLVLSTILLSLQLLTLNYKEDISDFLPLDKNHQKALKIYQNISGANRIFAIIQAKDSTQTDPDLITEGINSFAEEIKVEDKNNIISSNLTTQIDMSSMTNIMDLIYGNIPLFLSSSDYNRFDSLLNTPNFVKEQLLQDKQMMMLPSGGMLTNNIQKDPLNLFSPILAKLQSTKAGINYEMYDGYIFSPDMQRGIVMLSSPFGPSETEKNTQLINLLNNSASKVIKNHPELDIHILGGPSIAVGNANQIKADSILSVSIAVFLISLLLLYCLRNLRNLLLIVVSIAWGWLFAMAGLSVVHDNISIIVVGISSVIIGIAVNYPLHLIAHLSHTPNTRMAIKEIVVPLLIGNVTTVGAFMALIPIDSIALRDLGIFCSFLLIGTILFVLVFLPHLIKMKSDAKEVSVLGHLSDFSLDNKPKIVWVVGILTIIFAYFSFKTSFDSNMNHINYMTDEQKADMEYFSKMILKDGDHSTVYYVSSGKTADAAIANHNLNDSVLANLKNDGLIIDYSGCSNFIVSKEEQQKRIERWNRFVNEYAKKIKNELNLAAQEEGFTTDSFYPFYQILNKDYGALNIQDYSALTNSILSSNISLDKESNTYSFVHSLSVDNDKVGAVEDKLNLNQDDDNFCFDIKSMNSAIATNLSANFNYIGWACGFIVFFFLWFSFGSIELAMLSFLPMALSWIWILGLMSIFGIQFNIVNIILATFIFGQGDDYTIFMTEGASYEYAYRKKMLSSYKNSITISALIMFIGIGTLIFAKHPALHSLAEVTIVGMFSVVLMAYLIPSLIFKWLVSEGVGKYRERPISLKPLASFLFCAMVYFFEIISVYLLGFFLFVVTKGSHKHHLIFQKYIHVLYKFDLLHLPTVKTSIINDFQEKFEKPAVIISNHQSMLDSMIFMALSSKCIFIANENVSNNIVIKQIFKWMGHINISDIEINSPRLEELRDNGYSFVIFPEGKRNAKSSIERFHKGAFYLAEQLQLDIIPVFIHGLNNVLPKNSFCLFPGTITIIIDKRIGHADTSFGTSYVEKTKAIHKYYIEQYQTIRAKYENADYFVELVKDRYRYKGVDVYSAVKKHLSKYKHQVNSIGNNTEEKLLFIDDSYGEYALLFALVNRNADILIYNKDDLKQELIRYAIDGLLNNIKVITSDEVKDKINSVSRIFVFNEADAKEYGKYNIIQIN